MRAIELLVVGIFAGAAATPLETLAEEKGMAKQEASTALQLPSEGVLPSLGGATAWLNSGPLSPSVLRGKVVVVDVWTYTCINWLRTEPYVRAWAEKYKDQGLVVIGVNSPDSLSSTTSTTCAGRPPRCTSFIHRDRQRFRGVEGTRQPVLAALYIVDAQGCIRHHQLQGGYEQSKRFVQGLCSRRATVASVMGSHG